MTPDNLEVLKWVSGVIGSIMTIAIIPLVTFIYKKKQERKKEREEKSSRIEKFMQVVTASHDEIKLLVVNSSEQLNEIKNKLSQTAMMLTAIIETSPHAYFICDNKGMCIAANDAILKLFNAQLSDMLGMGWLSFIHPEEVARVRHNWDLSLKDKSSRIQDHYRIINKEKYELNGELEIILHAAYKALFQYKEGELERAVGTVWSIDEDSAEDLRRNKAFDCIIKEFEGIKQTPTWSQIREEIKTKK